ncbi:YcxB family protein [Planococcus alpniumensis]|uniref:YcxB family protein n=1 Tax=Planococcus alpniumensis TaxID=2708345 RepID=UPI001B8C1734|nr:YcxB family protein [Planococcus sp. MSAK28401]
MQIQYQLTYDDVLTFQEYETRYSTRHKIRGGVFHVLITLLVFIVVASIIIILIPILFQFENQPIPYTPIFITAVLIALISAPFLKKIYVPVILWQYKQIFKKTKDRRWPRPIAIILKSEGLNVKSVHNGIKEDIDISWESIQKVIDYGDLYFLYIQKREALIIPKKNQTITTEQQEKLRESLKQHFPNIT